MSETPRPKRKDILEIAKKAPAAEKQQVEKEVLLEVNQFFLNRARIVELKEELRFREDMEKQYLRENPTLGNLLGEVNFEIAKKVAHLAPLEEEDTQMSVSAPSSELGPEVKEIPRIPRKKVQKPPESVEEKKKRKALERRILEQANKAQDSHYKELSRPRE